MSRDRDMIGSIGHADMPAFGDHGESSLLERANHAFRGLVGKQHYAGTVTLAVFSPRVSLATMAR